MIKTFNRELERPLSIYENHPEQKKEDNELLTKALKEIRKKSAMILEGMTWLIKYPGNGLEFWLHFDEEVFRVNIHASDDLVEGHWDLEIMEHDGSPFGIASFSTLGKEQTKERD